MSINGVKFITRVAACLAIFDTKPGEPAANTESEPETDVDLPAVPAERLSLRFYPERRITRSAGVLGIA